jgi:hypothetical protein
MLLCGTLPATPSAPQLLPSLSGYQLLDSLKLQHRRMTFLAEHLDHPAVSEGVTDAILEARDALTHAVKLQAELCRMAGLTL